MESHVRFNLEIGLPAIIAVIGSNALHVRWCFVHRGLIE